MKQLTIGEALNKAASYCTLCERCISEVTAKLTTWGVPFGEQQKIIARLQEEKFIDEQRYCRAFVNDKLRFNHWGRKKIIFSLYEKRVPKEFVNDAIEEIDEELYMSILKEVIAMKSRELKDKDDYSARQKMMRFAASRGFETNAIMRVIKCDDYEMDF